MSPVSASPRPPRVLLVDDDPDTRRTLRELLEEEGIAIVGEAGDGAEGIELARSLAPDVVLMDIKMPVLGGIEATRSITESLALTRVIVLTTYDAPSLQRSAEEAGASAYLLKGAALQHICDTIFEVVGFDHD